MKCNSDGRYRNGGKPKRLSFEAYVKATELIANAILSPLVHRGDTVFKKIDNDIDFARKAMSENEEDYDGFKEGELIKLPITVNSESDDTLGVAELKQVLANNKLDCTPRELDVEVMAEVVKNDI